MSVIVSVFSDRIFVPASPREWNVLPSFLRKDIRGVSTEKLSSLALSCQHEICSVRSSNYESHWWTKALNDWVPKKAGTELFLLHSRSRKESFLLCVHATERRKLHGERNNARYYFWPKKKRKTKNTLAGQHNEVDRADW